MIRKYKSDKKVIERYVRDCIGDVTKIYNEYREDVYKDFLRENPDCDISSHYFTRHINKICNTKIKLVCEKGNMVYIFVDKEENNNAAQS